MTKKRNTGFSMVEILISVTIFVILMIPIVSGIVSSLKMSTNAKELQYRNEFAEHMMEHVKSVSVDEMMLEDYYVKNGTSTGSFTTEVATTEENVDWNSDGTTDEVLKVSKYTIKGKTALGTQSTPYNYLIEVDNQYYVDKRKNDIDFVDPNNLSLGIVEDIDYTKVALIDGTILNYDTVADTSFKTKKLQALKEEDETLYQQEMSASSSASSRFIDDTASRLARIEITGDADDGYTVKCMLDYIDSSNYSKGEMISYTPYAQSFSELPNIYLMYNPCFYNRNYTANDYIAIDTSGITDTLTKMPEVKVFLVEIARSYSQDILNSKVLDETTIPESLYYDDPYNKHSYRDTCTVHLSAVVNDNKQLNKISVYHNIGDNYNSLDDEKNDKDKKRNSKTAKAQFWYRDDGANKVVDGQLQTFGIKLGKTFSAIQLDASYAAYVGALNTATDETRGLYEVKIWLKEASSGDIDKTKDQPILQGTKGGNES